MQLADLVYSVVTNRYEKYGHYSRPHVYASVIFYCNKLNIVCTYTAVMQIMDKIQKGQTYNCIALDTLKDPAVSKFSLPSNAILRFAACPNTEPTFLSLKGLSIHRLLQIENPTIKVYLRFDDTSPGHKYSTNFAYKRYIQACKWLGLQVEVVYASAEHRLERYYAVGRALLVSQQAYMLYKNQKIYDTDFYDKFVRGTPGYESAVYKVKHEQKDWVGLRYVARQHVKTKTHKVWPTLNFHSPIDDVDYKITHIFRGKDLLATEKYQKSIYTYLNSIDINCVYWGRNRLEHYSVHSSSLAKGKRLYDANCIFFTNLIYYQIEPAAVLAFYKEIGLSNTDTVLNIGLLRKHQKAHTCINYTATEHMYLHPYTEHITNKKGYIWVDKAFRKFGTGTVLRVDDAVFKINPYRKLIKLI